MPRKLMSLLFAALALSQPEPAYPRSTQPLELRITVLFNNVPQRPGLTTGWGFACLIEGLEKTILFDTGADGAVLLANMRHLDLSPKAVEAIVLSYIHADHTGGLDEFLAKHADLEVWLPAEFPAGFQRAIAKQGARVRPVSAGGRLFGKAWSTGPLADGIVEQALILDTAQGLVVITGCAHPGIVRIAETAGRLTGKRIRLLIGGFHLGGTDRTEIQAIIGRLRALGVEKVAPSHCTGEAAIAQFRQAWGKDFVEGGLGAVIEVPLR
ncbi:MAG: MBL fold metallo-hydrolase [Hydrogenophilaceae bacterium]|nr:MBL fold metallo-hydrolase [Hydrogenophilaceae bacterium]